MSTQACMHTYSFCNTFKWFSRKHLLLSDMPNLVCPRDCFLSKPLTQRQLQKQCAVDREANAGRSCATCQNCDFSKERILHSLCHFQHPGYFKAGGLDISKLWSCIYYRGPWLSKRDGPSSKITPLSFLYVIFSSTHRGLWVLWKRNFEIFFTLNMDDTLQSFHCLLSFGWGWNVLIKVHLPNIWRDDHSRKDISVKVATGI